MSFVLHHFGRALGQPDLSPFCVKLETYLRMAEVDYTTAFFSPRQAPKGKAPYIQHEGAFLGDSAQVIEYIKVQELGADLDEDLDAHQRAEARLLQSMLEEHLYFGLVYMRWQLDAGWAEFRPTCGDAMKRSGVPGFLVPLVLLIARRNTIKALKGQGIGRHSEQEVVGTILELLQTAEAFLGDGPFMLGEQVTAIDATAFAMLGSILGSVRTPLSPHLEGEFVPLREYCARMQSNYFPELA